MLANSGAFDLDKHAPNVASASTPVRSSEEVREDFSPASGNTANQQAYKAGIEEYPGHDSRCHAPLLPNGGGKVESNRPTSTALSNSAAPPTVPWRGSLPIDDERDSLPGSGQRSRRASRSAPVPPQRETLQEEDATPALTPVLEEAKLLQHRGRLVIAAAREPAPLSPGMHSSGEAAQSCTDSVRLSEGSRWGYGDGRSGSACQSRHSSVEPSAERRVGPLRHDHSPTREGDAILGPSSAEGGVFPDSADAEDSVEAIEEALRRLRSVQQWVDSYRSAFVPAYPPFEHALGIVNPLSGENNAATLVERGMLAEFGGERVVLLNAAIFSEPAILRNKMKTQAFLYHDPAASVIAELTALLKEKKGGAHAASMAVAPTAIEGGVADAEVAIFAEAKPGRGHRQARARQAVTLDDESSCCERGTVIIAGGDGTVSFIMNQMHLARCEIEAELFQLLRPHVPLVRSASSGGHHPERTGSSRITVDDAPFEKGSSTTATAGAALQKGGRLRQLLTDVKRYYTIPAVGPIPMGTGNDYSNCVGFGSGFTYHRGFGLCCCCESDVGELLHALVDAPGVPFDRWKADFIPLRIAQENLRPLSASSTGSGRPLEPNVANTVHHVEWNRIEESGDCTSHTITNYLGIGFDAFVTTQFAKTRKSHPALCSSRLQNKALYGVFGVQGGVTCRTIRHLIPMVCVPSPWSTPAARDTERATELSRGRPAMVALQLPSSSKALVMSNVSRYSAGTQPWAPTRGGLYYRPVELTHREARVCCSNHSGTNGGAGEPAMSVQLSASTPAFPSSAAAAAPASVNRPLHASFTSDSRGTPENRLAPARTTTHRPPFITPVAINDRKFELQSMGGLLSYATLGLGLKGATKITQTGEMFVFALCTPEDLRYERAGGISSPYSRNALAKYEARLRTDTRVQASLNVQIDGEAIPQITEPTIVHVHPMSVDRIYVRCRNPKVIRYTSRNEAVSATTE